MQRLSKFIFGRILGWKLIGNFPKHLKKYIVIAAPHTSWLDFPIGLLARSSSKIKINFIAKNSLFDGFFGFIFHFLGGTPIDRSKRMNTVDSTVSIFNAREEFRLAIAPEGTRKKVTAWKTGFYFIAKGANVPIVMTTLDFKNKQVKISEPYHPTENKEKDFKYFKSFYQGIKGRHPEKS